MEITEENLQTLKHYALFSDLLDSNGIVDENVLNKLRLHARALLEQNSGDEDLLSLCHDVLFHDNMKAFALHELILLYVNWSKESD